MFYNDIILKRVTAVVSATTKRLMNATRKVSRIHENIIVGYKGNPKNIKDKFGEIQFNEELDDLLNKTPDEIEENSEE